MKCTTFHVLSRLVHCFRVSISSIIKYVFMSKNVFDEKGDTFSGTEKRLVLYLTKAEGFEAMRQ